MMKRTTCCPKCGYQDKADAGFEVCPRCGLIIAKYLMRQNKETPVDKAADEAPPPQVHSQPAHRSRKKALLYGVLCLLIVTGALWLIREYKESDSGSIVWSRSSTEPFRPYAIAIDEGYLYVVGVHDSTDFKNWHWQLEKRQLTDGALVSEFGNNGVVTVASGEHFFAPKGLAVQSGYLYLIGHESVYQMIDARWRIEKRRASDGGLVTEFGGSGFVVSEQPHGFKRPQSIVLDGEYMYVAGNEDVFPADLPKYPFHYQSRIEKRRLSDGMLVSDFGTAGTVLGDPITFHPVVLSGARIAMDSEFMYVSGAVHKGPRYDTEWRIEKRRLSDGSFSREFGDKGVVRYAPGPGYDDAHGIAIDEQYMYVVGHDAISGNPTEHEWHIEKRRLSDGALVDDFGTGGILKNNPSTGLDWAHAIVIDRDKPGLWERLLALDPFWKQRAMYVAGKDEMPGAKDQQWRIEKRRLSDGSSVRQFGKSGVIGINPSMYVESACAIASDADSLYVVGDDRSSDGKAVHSRIVKIKK